MFSKAMQFLFFNELVISALRQQSKKLLFPVGENQPQANYRGEQLKLMKNWTLLTMNVPLTILTRSENISDRNE